MMPLSALMGGFARPPMPGMQADPRAPIASPGGSGGLPPQYFHGGPVPDSWSAPLQGPSTLPQNLYGQPPAAAPAPQTPWSSGPVGAPGRGPTGGMLPTMAPSSGFPNPWGLAQPQQMPWQPNSSLSMLRGFF